MYSNIGGKIKTLAVVTAVLEAFGCVISGIVLIVTGAVLAGLGVLFGGVLLAWISSFVLYGFGQLVENSDLLAEQIRDVQEEKQIRAAKQQKVEERKRVERIVSNLQDNAFNPSEYIDFRCPLCGANLSYTKADLMSNEVLGCPHCNRNFYTKSIFRPQQND